MRKTVLFDLDDTLIDCSKYYRLAHEEGGAYISSLTRGRMRPNQVISVIAEIDLQAAKKATTFDKGRFANSFREALLACCESESVSYSKNNLETVTNIANGVFTAEYALRPGAKETLAIANDLGYQTLLVTKGDREVQDYKIEKHGLRDFFSRIHIVETKTLATWGSVVLANYVDIANSLVIGDSLKDDIAPSNALGLNTVHISTQNGWVYNVVDGVEPTFSVDTLPQVAELLVQANVTAS